MDSSRTLRSAGLVLSLAALVALSGCSTPTDGAEETPSAAASSTAASLPTASTSSSAVGAEEAAPAGYRFVEAPMLGLTLAIPQDMAILASGSDLSSMSDEELKAEADAEGKTVEEFHARWDNVDLVAYASNEDETADVDGVISVEVTLAPTLTALPDADALKAAAEASGLVDATTFTVDTTFGTGSGFQATNPASGDVAQWQMSSVYAATTDGTVFSLTLYTSDKASMDEAMPTILNSMATVGS